MENSGIPVENCGKSVENLWIVLERILKRGVKGRRSPEKPSCELSVSFPSQLPIPCPQNRLYSSR
ncbi:MAG: hypothetical protein ACFCBU_18385 [Cyanophyceae cyanobacterium]